MNLKSEFENFISENYRSIVKTAAQEAEKAGIKAYLIGGITRDLILNKPVKDIDITLEADAVSFCKALEQNKICRIVSVQENLRTVKAEFKNGAVIDFASAREEYYPEPGALPIARNFGCALEKDVKRRDFTINTLAIALTGSEKFNLIDYFSGLDDIKNKKIRILHEKSFIDDPSRIIRALKFQMRLGFEIEERTAGLMRQYLENFSGSIPLERIKNELRQYFSIEKANLYQILIKNKAYKLISSNPVLKFDEEALKTAAKYFDTDKIWFIYISLLLIHSNFENEKLNLTSSEKKTLNEVKELIKNPPSDDNLSIYNAFIETQELSPVIYYVITRDKSVIKFYEALQQVKILITGHDLIELGLLPSAAFKKLFEEVLKQKLNGALKTKEEELEFVKKYINQSGFISEK